MNKKILSMLSIILISAMILVGCSNANYSTGDKITGNNIGAADIMEDGMMESNQESQEQTQGSTAQQQEDIKNQEKLVYTCNLSLETLTYDETIKTIMQKIEEYNGIIEYEKETDNAYNWYYENYVKDSGTMNMYLTIRIPSEKYEEFLSSIEGSGRVVSKDANVLNISKQYYETEAIIESLKIQEQRLLEMMNKAQTIDDMITIETRLTEVQTELNKYNTELESMDTDVAYSTINISIDEVLEYNYSEQGKKTNTFIDRLKNTIVDSWEFFFDSLEGILFFIIRMIPVAVIIGVIGIPCTIIIKKKIIKKKKEEKDK